MKISVIVPTYKPQSYIWTCLESLCHQTFPQEEFEVIIVLNGCKEPYDKDIRNFIQEHNEVQWVYIQTDHGGVSNARNIALDRARGEYVSFIDDDDFVSPEYLKELYENADGETVSISYPFGFNDGDPATQIKYDFTEIFNRYSSKKKYTSSKVRKFFSGPCMKLINMSFIQDRRFDVRFKNGEDSIFMFLISDEIKYCSFTSPKAIYYRRFRENSAISSQKSKKYILSNCWMRFKVYSHIYFSNPFRYSLRRYMLALLGIIHILIKYLLK